MFRSVLNTVRLSLLVLSLLLSGCSGPSISITASLPATESPPPTRTLEPDGPTSKIDKTLSFLT